MCNGLARKIRPLINLPWQTINEALNKKFLIKLLACNISSSPIPYFKAQSLTFLPIGDFILVNADLTTDCIITMHNLHPKIKLINLGLRAISSSNGMLSDITHNK